MFERGTEDPFTAADSGIAHNVVRAASQSATSRSNLVAPRAWVKKTLSPARTYVRLCPPLPADCGGTSMGNMGAIYIYIYMHLVTGWTCSPTHLCWRRHWSEDPRLVTLQPQAAARPQHHGRRGCTGQQRRWATRRGLRLSGVYCPVSLKHVTLNLHLVTHTP